MVIDRDLKLVTVQRLRYCRMLYHKWSKYTVTLPSQVSEIIAEDVAERVKAGASG